MPIRDLPPSLLTEWSTTTPEDLASPFAPADPAARPTSGDIWSAAFRTENIVGSTAVAPDGYSIKEDPDFSAWARIEGTPDERFYPHLAATRNEEEYLAKLEHLRQLEKDRETLYRGGWEGVAAGMTAGILDITTLIPFGAGVKAGRGATFAAKMYQGAKAGAITAPPATLVAEIGLHSTQPLRTTEESAMAIAMSPVLGAGIGALGSAVGHAVGKGMKRMGWSTAVRGVAGDRVDEFMSIPGSREALERGNAEMAGAMDRVRPRDADIEAAAARRLADADEAREVAGAVRDAAEVKAADDIAEGVDPARYTAEYKAEHARMIRDAEAGGLSRQEAEDLADLVTSTHFSLLEKAGWTLADTRELFPNFGRALAQDEAEAIAYGISTGQRIEIEVGGKKYELSEVARERGPKAVGDLVAQADAPSRRAAFERSIDGPEPRPRQADKPNTDELRARLERGDAVEQGVRVVKEREGRWRVDAPNEQPRIHRTRSSAVDQAVRLVRGVGADDLREGARIPGVFESADGMIRRFANADPATVKREFASGFVHLLLKASETAKATPQLKAAAARLREFLGVKNYADFLKKGRSVEKRFVDGFERYIGKGEAPSPALRTLFETFKDWVQRQVARASDYAARWGRMEEFPDSVRQVVDEWLAPSNFDWRRAFADELDGGSVGAAKVEGPDIADYKVPGVAEPYMRATSAGGVVNPVATAPNRRIALSRSAEARKTGMELFENYFGVRAAERGDIGPAVETAVGREVDLKRAALVRAVGDNFLDYSKRMGQSRLDRSMIRAGGRGLNEAQFSEQIGKAMRRGDQHEIPEVAKAAQELRREIFDPLKDAAIKAGLLPEDVDVETAASYLSRVWNTDEIKARQPEFVARLTKHFEGGMRRARGEAIKARDAAEAAQAALEKARAARNEAKASKSADRLAAAKDAVSDAEAALKAAKDELKARDVDDIGGWDDLELQGYARIAAEDVYGRLTDPTFDLRQAGNVAQLPASKVRGPLKERTLNVRDLDFEDFLVSDVMPVTNRYIRVMATDVELTNRYGSADMKERIDAIVEDYARVKETATSAKERLAIDRERDKVVNAIESGRDLLRGDRSNYELKFGRRDTGQRTRHEIVRTALAANYVQILGDVYASSLPDIFRGWQVHGARAWFSSALPAMWSRIRGDKTLRKITVEEAGIAETILNSRIAAMADLDDPYAARWGITPYMETLTTRASKLSGIVYWNQFGKEVAVNLYIARMRRMFDRFKQKGFESLSADDRLYLRQLKVSRRIFERIGRQMDDHGERAGMGLFEPNTSRWTDSDALDVFRLAMRADVDSVIVSPGLGDKPLIFQHTALKPLAQFKNFWFAADQRALVRGLQGDGRNFTSGMMAMVAIGMLVSFWKYASSGREMPENWGTLVAEGVDRSGSLPLLMELNNIQEHFTKRGFYGLMGAIGRATGAEGESRRASRYQDRLGAEVLIGPTAGLLQALGTVVAHTSVGDWDRSTIRAIKRLTPFANQPAIKLFLNNAVIPAAEEAVAD